MARNENEAPALGPAPASGAGWVECSDYNGVRAYVRRDVLCITAFPVPRDGGPARNVLRIGTLEGRPASDLEISGALRDFGVTDAQENKAAVLPVVLVNFRQFEHAVGPHVS